jgi:hypothetical protein
MDRVTTSVGTLPVLTSLGAGGITACETDRRGVEKCEKTWSAGVRGVCMGARLVQHGEMEY